MLSLPLRVFDQVMPCAHPPHARNGHARLERAHFRMARGRSTFTGEWTHLALHAEVGRPVPVGTLSRTVPGVARVVGAERGGVVVGEALVCRRARPPAALGTIVAHKPFARISEPRSSHRQGACAAAHLAAAHVHMSCNSRVRAGQEPRIGESRNVITSTRLVTIDIATRAAGCTAAQAVGDRGPGRLGLVPGPVWLQLGTAGGAATGSDPHGTLAAAKVVWSVTWRAATQQHTRRFASVGQLPAPVQAAPRTKCMHMQPMPKACCPN